MYVCKHNQKKLCNSSFFVSSFSNSIQSTSAFVEPLITGNLDITEIHIENK